MSIPTQHPKFTIVLLTSLLALAIYFAYAPGLSGSLFYDDELNLRHLQNVHDFQSAKEFILGGYSGPLGRPIALASFIPHAADWPENSADILQINVFIHIINALLLLWLGYLLLYLTTQLNKIHIFYTALSAAALWALLPLLASTSLIAIQRMTSLSALFTLLALIGFVYGYYFQAHNSFRAFIIQMLVLAIGTTLAVFTKENGALTPLYALVIDSILIRKFNTTRYDLLRRRLLQLGLIILLIYLSPLFRDWFTFNEYRQFSSWERLNTQIVILWQHLYLAFLPQQPTFFGPYHDDVVLITNTSWVIFATIAWLIVLFASIKLFSRTPWPLFALLWFFTGHLLESTVILLELFFEHRNYLAVYGFCLALAVAAWSASGRLARIWPLLLGIYIIMLGGILLAITIRWGDPQVARISWVETHPGSSRAALRYIHLEPALKNISTSLSKSKIAPNSIKRSLAVLDRSINICPNCTEIRMQALLLSCLFTDADNTANRFSDILQHASQGKLNISVLDSLFPLREWIASDNCKPLNFSDLNLLLELFLKNPRYQVFRNKTRLHFIAAMVAEDNKDYPAVKQQLSLAESFGPNALPILQYQVYFFRSQQRVDDALAAIDRRRKYVNKNNKIFTKTTLDQLEKEARDTEKQN